MTEPARHADTAASTDIVEMVLRVRFPRHSNWDDETAERVRGFVLAAMRDGVRNFYGTKDWAEASVEELGRPWRSTQQNDGWGVTHPTDEDLGIG